MDAFHQDFDPGSTARLDAQQPTMSRAPPKNYAETSDIEDEDAEGSFDAEGEDEYEDHAAGYDAPPSDAQGYVPLATRATRRSVQALGEPAAPAEPARAQTTRIKLTMGGGAKKRGSADDLRLASPAQEQPPAMDGIRTRRGTRVASGAGASTASPEQAGSTNGTRPRRSRGAASAVQDEQEGEAEEEQEGEWVPSVGCASVFVGARALHSMEGRGGGMGAEKPGCAMR